MLLKYGNAAKELNIQISGIIYCCKGSRTLCGGFKWRYVT